MGTEVMQKSFNSGEWAPQLYSRVDVEKYHSGAALIKNFFVDYRGGVSTRPGTKFIAAAGDSTKAVRLIPFQASVGVTYILELGDGYMRFYTNGAQVLSGGSPYQIITPYAAADLAQIKFAQNVNTMILCHPGYQPRLLTLNGPTNWVLSIITFGTTSATISGLAVTTTLSAGSVNYGYIVTGVGSNGDESVASSPVTLTNKQDLRSVSGSNSISWNPSGASSYNVYKTTVSYFATGIPSGVPYGFIGNVSGTSLVDSNISPDYAQTPPMISNPFVQSSVQSITINTEGSVKSGTTVGSVTFTGGGMVIQAVGQIVIGENGLTLASSGSGYAVNDIVVLWGGVAVQITSMVGSTITAWTVTNRGNVTTGTLPASIGQISTTGGGSGISFLVTWSVIGVNVISGGQYATTPAVTFLNGSNYNTLPTATANMSSANYVNPGVPGFFQQRLVLCASTIYPETLNFSQPGSYFNYNLSNPIQANDAINVTLASGQLETIRSIIATAPGLVVFTDKSSWLITGGSLGSAVSPASIVANRQSYNGANDLPPILNNYDILYVEARGSAVRDASYNYYAQVFTGEDISVNSSHLFFGYQLTEWAWAQAPYRLVWAVRNDGALLSLTFAKEQQFIAWAQHDTQGQFLSIATVPETLSDGMIVDAVYVVVQRTVNGSSIKYIERLDDRLPNQGKLNAWCVDAGITYNGSPTTSFSGAAHLAGCTVTGLADGLPITPFVMPGSGVFTLPVAASKVVIGLGYTPQLKTLPINIGEPTIQGKQKKITSVTVRCVESLGLYIGSSFNTLTIMKDLVLGNIGTLTNTLVSDLVTGDVETIVDPLWSEQGQFCIQQNYPWPATITGVIPEITVGSTAK